MTNFKNAQNPKKKSSAQGRNQKNFKRNNKQLLNIYKNTIRYITNIVKYMRKYNKRQSVQTNKTIKK